MKKIFLGAFVALFAFVAAQAAEPDFTLKLYPKGQNVDEGIIENGSVVTLGPGESNGLTGPMSDNGRGSLGNTGDDARMDIYIPDHCNGQMIVVCPGGGYSHLSSINEGTFVADWCDKQGIAACVVLYRMPNGHSAVPLTDVQNAFRYCRAHSAEWGIKQIGVMGFSAGGHLAASASTLYVDGITRPDFSVLIYPVVTMEEFVTHAGSRFNLLGEKAGKDAVEKYSIENQVNAKTPPAILCLSADDGAVPPENSIRYFRAMQKYGVSGELHIFTSGRHGWGFTTVENSGHDNLGIQRDNFFEILDRWLAARR